MHVNAARRPSSLTFSPRLRDIIENRSHSLNSSRRDHQAALMSDEAVIAVRRLNERAPLRFPRVSVMHSDSKFQMDTTLATPSHRSSMGFTVNVPCTVKKRI